jgi:peptidoglycan/LPS O-acetylase OafA/YrhL
MGVLLAIFLHSRSGFEQAWKIIGHRRSAWITGAMALAIANWPGPASAGWYLAQAMVFTLFLAACVIRRDHGLANILNTKILIRIGVVSYGMYLLHMLAVNSVRVVLPRLGIDSQGLTFLLALLLAYIAAEISFRLFETPILNLKKRLGASRPE